MSNTRKKARTMYMHTLDGKPAIYRVAEVGGACISKAYGKRRVPLVPSRQQIRHEWNHALASRERELSGHVEAVRAMMAVEVRRYGYVLVEVLP